MSVARMGPRGWLVLGLLGVLVLPSACDPLRGGPREAIAEEEDEEVTLQVTVWQKGYEIFLEHLPIVAGEPVTFITHVTDLEALLPRSEGPVTFVLRDGASPPIERTDPAPARAGIYTPALEFPRTGTWSVALRIPDLPPREGETLVELPPFVVHADRATAGQAPVPEAPDGISFLKEQQWKVRTRTEPATGRTMVERLVLPGEVSASPRRRAVVTAPLAGHLLAPVDGQLPSLGERVEAGMALAVVRPPLSSFAVGVVEAEAEVIEARLALDLAERTHERVRLLAEDRTRSEADLQEAAFERDAARARLEAAEAKRAAYRKAGAIRLDEKDGGTAAVAMAAPIGGVVVRVGATVGEHVTPDRAVLEILDPSVVHVSARVPEADIRRVAGSLGAVVEPPDAPGSFLPIIGEGGDGRVVLRALEVDPVTRTAPIVYELPNPDGLLRPGMAVVVHLETARAKDAIAVPESAIVDEEGQTVAFVQLAGETFEKRFVKLGIRDRGHVEILDGVAAGEQVVVDHAYTIRLASVSTTIPAHGHAH